MDLVFGNKHFSKLRLVNSVRELAGSKPTVDICYWDGSWIFAHFVCDQQSSFEGFSKGKLVKTVAYLGVRSPLFQSLKANAYFFNK